MDHVEFKNLEPEPKGLPGVWPGQSTWVAGIKPLECFQAIKILGKEDTTDYIGGSSLRVPGVMRYANMHRALGECCGAPN